MHPDDDMTPQAFVDLMKKLGIATVRASFNGSGDSGEIYDTSFVKEDDTLVEPDKDVDNWWVGYVSESIPFDWYNNEGGWGEVTLNVSEGKMDIDGHQRYEASNHMPSQVVIEG